MPTMNVWTLAFPSAHQKPPNFCLHLLGIAAAFVAVAYFYTYLDALDVSQR